MNPEVSLSEAELEELDVFLMSDEMPEGGMDISALDGFLAAIVLNPRLVPPSQWLPWIWDMENGEASPVFADSQQADRIIGFILRHYNAVANSIAGGRFDPLLLQLKQEDGSEFLDAESWCEGFMLGVSMFMDSWRSVLKEHSELVASMVLLGTEKGWKILEDRSTDDETRRRLAQETCQALPAAVAALYEHFRPEREQEAHSGRASSAIAQPVGREMARVGRNDPCPCGSGKKFKQCCGAPQALH